MYETLLFLHVLSAFMLMVTVVLLSGAALGANIGSGAVTLGNRLWDIGGIGTLVFGIWIVAREDLYEITDAWIIGAIVLWFAVSGIAGVGRKEIEGDRFTARGVQLHWVRAALVVGFLVLMIWKPGAV